MTQQEVQTICEQHGILFKDYNYGRATRRTIMLMTLHQVVNQVILSVESSGKDIALAPYDPNKSPGDVGHVSS